MEGGLAEKLLMSAADGSLAGPEPCQSAVHDLGVVFLIFWHDAFCGIHIDGELPARRAHPRPEPIALEDRDR